MRRKPRITKEQITDVLEEYRISLNLRKSCEATGVNFFQMHKYLQVHPDIKKEFEEVEQAILFSIETKALQMAEEGDVTLIKFLLEKLAPAKYNKTPVQQIRGAYWHVYNLTNEQLEEILKR
jgi:hypothetical protein